MSREIKFRAWDGEKYLHHSGGKFDREWIYLKIEGGIWSKWGNFASYTKNLVLQQYTGLKDKNGKEIYEGDILHVTYHNIKAEVLYDDRFCLFKLSAANSLSFYVEACAYLEVIGNIFENPELL
jgi:uncharacterized phage protein (TIGR01671 family)